jgi:predicted nucleotidyltransferase
MQNAYSLLEALLSSRVRARLLAIFLLDPEGRFHAQALARSVGAHYSAVWKELVRLERFGILQSDASSRIKYYSLSPRLPILQELRSIILKTIGAGDAIRQALPNSAKIDAAFIYGSFAAGEMDANSDLDLMIIGDVELSKLAPVISKLEKQLGRAVNYTMFTREEWHQRQSAHDPFIANVLTSPKTILIGDEAALRRTSETGTHQTVHRAPRRKPKTPAGRGARSFHRRTQSLR